MFDKPHANHTFGIELDGDLLKSAELTLVKGKESLAHTFSITLDSSSAAEHANPLEITEEGQKFLKGIQQKLSVSTLESDEVLIRTLDIKLKKEKDIDSVLAFQAEPLLPYPVENAVLDRVTLNQTQEGTQVAIIAARKDHLKQHLEKLTPLKIDPDVISCVPVALAFYSKLVTNSANSQFVLHLAKKQTTCALVKDGKLLAAQTSSMGLDSLTHHIPLGTPEIDFKNPPAQNKALAETLEQWRRDVTRLIFALSKLTRDVEATDLLITGEGAIYKNLGEVLALDAHKQIVEPVVPTNFQIPAAQLQRFAVSIGAALSALENIKDQINFRQEEFAHPHPWRHLKQPIALYFILCLALALAFYLYGKANIAQQEDRIRQEYVDLLSTMNKSYPAFEKEYITKYAPTKGSEEDATLIANLTPEDIAQRLQVLHKDLKETPDIFPMHPNVPRVSDVLAWLSTHPTIVGMAKEGQGAGQPLIQIESLLYTMVKRPELKKKQEKYQVKVEIEFSTATPKLAREFHDALIAPNAIVDPKGEVKWSSNRGKYRASFFLKDKTAYPSMTNTEG